MSIFEEKKLRPMPFTPGQGAFQSPEFIFEMDPAGARCIAYLGDERTTLRSERNMEILPLFPELSELHGAVSARCILDGQLIVPEGGQPDSRALLNRISACVPPMVKALSAAHPAKFIASDILYLGDEQLLSMPLIERRRLLRETVEEGPLIGIASAVDTAGAALYELSRQQDLPGMLARRKSSHYLPGEASPDWLRIGGRASEVFVACGVVQTEGKISLVLGRYEGLSLSPRGRLSRGVKESAIAGFATTAHCPFAEPPEGTEGARWFDPLRLCLLRRAGEAGAWRFEGFLG